MGETRRRAGTLLIAVVTTFVLALTGFGLVAPAQAATTLAAPLPNKTYVLSSYYGPRCMPVVGSSTNHLGQDMSAKKGTKVRSVAAGTVTRAGKVSGFGQWVVIDHVVDGVRFSSLYAHVVDGDKYVKKGTKVRKGQHIADVGSTGTSTSPHLHLEIYRGGYPSGTAVDPLKFLRDRGTDLRQLSTRNNARTVPSSCTYYTAKKVNLRSGPGTSYRALRTMPANVVLKAKPGAGSGEWRQVTRAGQSGWVHRDYVSPKYTSQGTRYVLPTKLNMRTKASTSSAVRMTLPKNAKLTMLRDVKGNWQRVRYSGKNGWVHIKHISAKKGGPSIASTK